MSKRLLLAALIAVVSLSMVAQAKDEISYNYVNVAYMDASVDDAPDADGYGLDVSIAVHPKIHLFGGYGDFEFDGISADQSQTNVGVAVSKSP